MKPTKQTVYLPANAKDCDFIVNWYDESYENDVKKEEGYFFTPEQLNKYTANIIKQALETAAEKSLLSINGILEKSNGPKYIVEQGNHYCETEIEISKESITNTFEETFKRFKHE